MPTAKLKTLYLGETISIGIGLSAADAALYQAKHAGKNKFRLA